MNRKIKFHSKVIPYTIIKTNRIKTSQISVDKDNVIVRIPKSKSYNEIKYMVNQKARWIYKKQEEFRKDKSSIVKPTFSENTTVPYFGKNCILKVKLNQKKNSVKVVKSKFIINLISKRSFRKKIQKTYEEWIKNKASKYLETRTIKLASKIGIKPTKIEIKLLKGRWGSASKDGRISLNSNLLKLPKDIIDYIIIHELCHLKIDNHSYRYWQLVRKHMNNYDEKKKRIEKYGNDVLT